MRADSAIVEKEIMSRACAITSYYQWILGTERTIGKTGDAATRGGFGMVRSCAIVVQISIQTSLFVLSFSGILGMILTTRALTGCVST